MITLKSNKFIVKEVKKKTQAKAFKNMEVGHIFSVEMMTYDRGGSSTAGKVMLAVINHTLDDFDYVNANRINDILTTNFVIEEDKSHE